MREVELKGTNSEWKGSKTNPITEIQKSIFKAINIKLGIEYDYDNYTSYTAWKIISVYAHRIKLRYYTNNKNEIPRICIDGEEVYKRPTERPTRPTSLDEFTMIEVDDLEL
jgi:hypothetical protein